LRIIYLTLGLQEYSILGDMKVFDKELSKDSVLKEHICGHQKSPTQ